MDKVNLTFPSDELFTTSVRLTIMILLFNHKKINFTELQKLLRLTPGNLDHHLKKLETAKYVRTYKKLSSLRRPLTIVEITPQGKTAFEDYIASLREVLNKIALSSEK
ncbi:MAG: transcriptional regulator [Candidatus Hodarchaeales archaeon]